MKSYTITVNGNVYDVQVEENVGASTPAVAAAPAPVAAPIAKAAAPVAPVAKVSAPAAPKVEAKAGSISIISPMPGKILSIKANVGDALKKGDVILLLEAMKMENEVVATEDGVVASIQVASNDMVEAGAVLATLN